jgi:cytochrome c5
MRWLLVTLLTTAAALAAGQNASLPEGDGKAIVAAGCVSCHGLDLITAKKAPKAEWTSIMDRMRSYGATLDDKQNATVIDYLTKNFGPPGAAPAPATPAPGGAGDTEAKALVSGMCASCHGADLITSKKADKAGWQDTVDRMKGYGASLTPAQTTNLVDYLVRTYGPAGAASTASAAAAKDDPGKATLEGFCGGCHDLDLVSGRKGTKAEWQDIVDRMNARGAGVPDKEIGPLVEYLTKTYGAK